MQRPFHHGPQIVPEGVLFNFWSPDAQSVELIAEGHAPQPMPLIADGWRRALVPGAREGLKYNFRLNKDDKLIVPDFGSRFQPSGMPGASQVVDTHRLAKSRRPFQRTDWASLKIYQLHLGAFSPEGNYNGLVQKISHLKKLGVNAVQLMPLHEIPGTRGWGYDPTLPFAVTRNYGSPDELCSMIDAMHNAGISVLFDVVYNHFGPDQEFTNHYAKAYTGGNTPWGKGPDFSERAIREYVIEHVMEILHVYGADGVRLDACHAMVDDKSPVHLFDELSSRVRASFPKDNQPFLVQENDQHVTQFLENGWDGVWVGDPHNALRALWLEAKHHYYADYTDNPIRWFTRSMAEGYGYQGQVSPNQSKAGKIVRRGQPSAHLSPQSFVISLENHDHIGNSASNERLMEKLSDAQATQAMDLMIFSPHVPMFFMGQLEHSTTKFRYFTDWQGALAEAVRKGRTREFQHDPDFDGNVPDPSDPQSFLDSKMDWGEIRKSARQSAIKKAAQRLTLRDQEIVPFIQKFPETVKQEILGRNQGMAIAWRAPDGEELEIVANMSTDELPMPAINPSCTVWQSQPNTAVGSQTLAPFQTLVLKRNQVARTLG